jgi:hypothetical protein
VPPQYTTLIDHGVRFGLEMQSAGIPETLPVSPHRMIASRLQPLA